MESYYEQVTAQFSHRYNDEFIINHVDDFLRIVIQNGEEFTDHTMILNIVSAGTLRRLKGFHAHKHFMRILVGLNVSAMIAVYLSYTGAADILPLSDAEKFKRFIADISSRCLPKIMENAVSKFGVPESVPNKEIEVLIKDSREPLREILDTSYFESN